MEVIYADKNRKDIGVLEGYDFDIAYGKDENDFSLKLDLSAHCCKEEYYVYIEGTEYGGIIDRICPDTRNDTIEYQGRTWHGMLESKIIEPDVGQDFLVMSGEANNVLRALIRRMDLEDLFQVSTEDSGIEIINYQFNRYDKGYTSIRKMLYSVKAKLVMKYSGRYIELSVMPLYDYSEDEEWDSSQMSFVIKKNYHPVNHLICLGRGDLRNRKVIHLFADKNGGLQPYGKVSNPYQDAHYILDKSKQILKGQDEVTDIYDLSNAEIKENYILLTAQPANWSNVCTNYFIKNGDNFEHPEKQIVETYTPLNTAPADWSKEYGNYLFLRDGEYVNTEGVESTSYVIQQTQPVDWTLNYSNYFYYFSDGLSWEYKSVDAVSNERYVEQTMMPSDWNMTYKNYYAYVPVYIYIYTYAKKQKGGVWLVTNQYKKEKVQNKKTKTEILTYERKIVEKYEYRNLDSAKAPTWKAGKYYTKENYSTPPAWKQNYYYTKITAVNAPMFISGKYYTNTTKILIPQWKSNTYYQLYIDNYAELVAGGIEKMQEYYNCDELETALNSDYEYDIGDIIGAREGVTGIYVSQPITKKIININQKMESITYEIGE